MSFKIIKGRKIQEWLDETISLIKVILEREKIPIELRKLPPQLQERILVNVEERRKYKYTKEMRLAFNRMMDRKDITLESLLESDITLVVVNSLKKEGNYEYTWSEKAPFPLIFKKYLEFILKSMSIFIEDAENEPINIEERISGGWKTGGTWAGTGWAFKGYVYEIEYKDQLPYSKEEEELLILEHYDNERKKFEGLKRKYKSKAIEEEAYKRERISEEVRIAVWRRDDGKCAHCGSREKLEYDHIVPVSKGGGNTARNIELLCESCNRKKSNRIE